MSKPITQGVGISTLQDQLDIVSERVGTFQEQMHNFSRMAYEYRNRAEECQQIAADWDKQASEAANLLSLALQEKWSLQDAAREVC